MKLYIAVGLAVALLGITGEAVSPEVAVEICSDWYQGVTKDRLQAFYADIESYESSDSTNFDILTYLLCLLNKTASLTEGMFYYNSFHSWYAGQSSDVIEKVDSVVAECLPEFNTNIPNTEDWVLKWNKCMINLWPEVFEITTTSIYPNASDE